MASKAVAKVETNIEWKLAKISVERAAGALQSISSAEGFNPFDLPRISVPGGGGIAWEIPSAAGTQVEKTFSAVIMHNHDARKYWAEAYGRGENNKPPTCQSSNGLQGFGEPGGACAVCPLKANMECKQAVMLYLMLPDMVLPVTLSVPVMSVRPAKKYLVEQLAAFGDRPFDVMTEFSLVNRSNKGGIKYSAIAFERGEDLTPELAKMIQAYREQFVPYLDASYKAQRDAANEMSGADPASGNLWGGDALADSEGDMANSIKAAEAASASAVDEDDDIPQ